MNQQERMDEIMKILKKNNYVTVEYIIKKLEYSPTTVRRDLALLEKQGEIKRTYGGAELVNKGKIPFTFRRHFMKKEKRSIAAEAEKLIKDGDTVFLDPSTTTSYLVDYIINKKNVTVVTPHIGNGLFLFEHGVRTYITAGWISKGDSSGALIGQSLNYFNIDIGFIDSTGISKDGYMNSRYDSVPEIIRAIRRNCREIVVLTTGPKFSFEAQNKCISLSEVDYVISDINVDEKIKYKCPNTKFICVEKEV